MSKYLITKGTGVSTYSLNAFDNALLTSGIADYNLIKLSSILPANSERDSEVNLPKGSFLHAAFAYHCDDRVGIVISAAIAIAIPDDTTFPGVIMEASGEYEKETIEEIVEFMAKTAMDSRGISDYRIEKESISMTTETQISCVFAAVAIW